MERAGSGCGWVGWWVGRGRRGWVGGAQVREVGVRAGGGWVEDGGWKGGGYEGRGGMGEGMWWWVVVVVG